MSPDFCQLLLFVSLHTYTFLPVGSWLALCLLWFLPSFLSVVLISVSGFLFEGREGSWEEEPVAGQLGEGPGQSSGPALKLPASWGTAGTAGFEGRWWFDFLGCQQRPCQLPSPAPGVRRWPSSSAVPSALTHVSTAHSPVSSLAGRVGALPGCPFHGLLSSLLHTLHPFLIHSAFPEVEFCSSFCIFFTVFRWF